MCIEPTKPRVFNPELYDEELVDDTPRREDNTWSDSEDVYKD